MYSLCLFFHTSCVCITLGLRVVMDAAGAPTPRLILRIERRHCPNSSQFISLKTYKAHKRLYCDPDVCA